MVAVTGSSAAYPGYGSIHNIATVVYRGPLPPVTIDQAPNGIRLRFTSVPDHSYNIERALDLSG